MLCWHFAKAQPDIPLQDCDSCVGGSSKTLHNGQRMSASPALQCQYCARVETFHSAEKEAQKQTGLLADGTPKAGRTLPL